MSKMRRSPSALSRAFCKEHGWHYDLAERSLGRIKHDLFGIIDAVVLTHDEAIGVQVTSGDHHGGRWSKACDLLDDPDHGAAFRRWMQIGAKTGVLAFEVWSWRPAKGARDPRDTVVDGHVLRRERMDPCAASSVTLAEPRPS